MITPGDQQKNGVMICLEDSQVKESCVVNAEVDKGALKAVNSLMVAKVHTIGTLVSCPEVVTIEAEEDQILKSKRETLIGLIGTVMVILVKMKS